MPTDDLEHGECYKDSFHAMLIARDMGAEHDLVLVHGYPICTAEGTERFGRKFGHAWIERADGVVFDAASGKVLWKPAYYSVGQIVPEECQRYSFEEAAELAVEHEHYGPWRSPPPDAMFANQERTQGHFSRG